jgi:hypothetical protein
VTLPLQSLTLPNPPTNVYIHFKNNMTLLQSRFNGCVRLRCYSGPDRLGVDDVPDNPNAVPIV